MFDFLENYNFFDSCYIEINYIYNECEKLKKEN